MKIGGIRKQSLKDYPGKVSAVLFTLGCNLRCPYCYNTDLVFEKTEPIPQAEVEKFLEERKNFLQAMVISGGEPTLQPDLPEFCEKIKSYGYAVGIETNGTQPEVLEELVQEKRVDFIAMDVKAPPDNLEKYEQACGVRVDLEKIRKSIQTVKNFSHHEFRTTVVPGILDKADLLKIGKLIEGARSYRLQQFQPREEMISPKMKSVQPYPSSFFEQVKKDLEEHVQECKISL